MRIVSFILHAVKQGRIEVNVHRTQGCYGWARGSEIHVDPERGGSPIFTLVHEAMHCLFPKASEKWIKAREAAVFRSLTLKERKWLEKYLKSKKRKEK